MHRTISAATIMFCAAMACAAAVAAATWFSLSQPWLGIGLTANLEENRIEISAVRADGPARAIPPGSILVAVSPPQTTTGRVELESADLVEEPDFFDSYARISAFFARQAQLHALLKSDRLRLEIVDPAGNAETRDVVPGRRPLSDLPLVYWVQLLVGIGGVLIGTWIWSLRRGDWGAGMFALAGVSMLVFTFPAAIYSTRELALDGEPFRLLSAINHAGAKIFGGAMIALFLCHPRRIVKPAWLLLLPLVILPWLAADILHLAPDPATGSHLLIMAEMLLMAALAAWQWWLNRNDPRNRAAMRWLGLSIIMGAGAFVGIIVTPIVLGMTPVFNQGYSFLFFLLIYIGIALGLRRHRLFELDEWAFRILFYTVGAIALFVLDAILIYTLSLARDLSLGLSLLIIGFAYLPLRDMLLRRMITRRKLSDEELFRSVIDVAFSTSSSQRSDKWRRLLQHLFDPLEIRTLTGGLAEAELRQDGLELALPATAGSQALLLRHPWQGRALFGMPHLQLSKQLFSLMRQAEDSRDAYERGMTNERQRIAQDLHDDVGARLLSGLHKSGIEETRETLRESLADIRTIVSGLAGEKLPLGHVIGDLRHEMSRRLEAAGIALDWTPDALPQDSTLLEYQSYKNLASTLREITSNIVRHSKARKVTVRLSHTGPRLELQISDDGVGMANAPASGRTGNGLANMKRRLEEMNGSLTYPPVNRGTAITLTLPMAAS